MRDPSNIITLDYIERNHINVLDIHNLPEYEKEDYDLFNEKDIMRYFSDIEKMVRNSFEYRQMISTLKENLDMTKCSFYKNVSNEDSNKIKIHIHHEPITLFDLVIIIFNKRKECRESLRPEMIAKEVMYVHYCNMVGLIPLAETVHELVHNMYIFIPTTKVYGNYKKFVEMYEPWFSPEQRDVLSRIEIATQAYEDNMYLLEKNYIYLDMSGCYCDLPKLEDISNLMKTRLQEIKDTNIQLNDYPKTIIKPIIKKTDINII